MSVHIFTNQHYMILLAAYDLVFLQPTEGCGQEMLLLKCWNHCCVCHHVVAIIGFEAVTSTVNENDGIAILKVAVLGDTLLAPDAEVVVSLSTLPDTAKSGQLYILLSSEHWLLHVDPVLCI